MASWTIKGGRNGQYEAAFLERDVVAVGFSLHRSAADFPDRESLRAYLGAATLPTRYGDFTTKLPKAIWWWCSRFLNSDYPRRPVPSIRAGRFVGGTSELSSGRVDKRRQWIFDRAAMATMADQNDDPPYEAHGCHVRALGWVARAYVGQGQEVEACQDDPDDVVGNPSAPKDFQSD